MNGDGLVDTFDELVLPPFHQLSQSAPLKSRSSPPASFFFSLSLSLVGGERSRVSSGALRLFFSLLAQPICPYQATQVRLMGAYLSVLGQLVKGVVILLSQPFARPPTLPYPPRHSLICL